MKGIFITEGNRDTLASKFQVDKDDPDLLPIGYWLVTDFGNDETFETLTVENFTMIFSIVGSLKNGWKDLLKND